MQRSIFQYQICDEVSECSQKNTLGFILVPYVTVLLFYSSDLRCLFLEEGIENALFLKLRDLIGLFSIQDNY